MRPAASIRPCASFRWQSEDGGRRGLRRIGLLAALLAPVLVAQAALAAAAAPEIALGVGGSVSSAPYKRYDTQWMPLPLIDLDSEVVYIRGTALGVKVVHLDFLEVSAFAAYDATSFNASDTSDARLRALQDRDAGVAAGLEVRLLTPFGMLHASAAHDILGHSEAWSGALGYAYSVEFGPLELIPTVGLYWADSRHTSYYYGISGAESRASGLAAYDPGGGTSPYLGLAMYYSLTDNWEIFCSGEIVFLAANIQDSPMVGHARSQSLTLGLMYNF